MPLARHAFGESISGKMKHEGTPAVAGAPSGSGRQRRLHLPRSSALQPVPWTRGNPFAV